MCQDINQCKRLSFIICKIRQRSKDGPCNPAWALVTAIIR